jgi:hypothetical protein
MTGLTALNALEIAALKKGQILGVSGGAGLLARRQRRSFGSEIPSAEIIGHKPVHSAERRIANDTFGHEIKGEITPRIKCRILRFKYNDCCIKSLNRGFLSRACLRFKCI